MYSPSTTIIPVPAKPVTFDATTTSSVLLEERLFNSFGAVAPVAGPRPSSEPLSTLRLPATLTTAADACTCELPPPRQKFPSVMIDSSRRMPPVPMHVLMSPQLYMNAPLV